MATNNEMSIVVSVKDQATAQLKKIQASFNQYSTGLAVGGAGIVAAFGFITKSAVDAEVAQNRFATAMKNSAGASDEQVRALQEQQAALQATTRYEDDAIASGQAVLASYNLSAQSIGALTPRILDMAEAQRKATGTTVDLEGVSAALGKAIETGSLDMLQRSLVSIPGNTKAMKELTKAHFEQANAQERVAILGKVLDGNFKGLAVSAGKTFAGQLDILKNTFGDLSESIGMQIIPILAKALQAITPVVAKITQWIAKNPELTKTLLLAAGVFAGLLIVVPALASAIAFIISPIGLATIAIAGVVAIGVVLIRHWDYVKQYAPKIFTGIMMVIGAFSVDVIRAFYKIVTSTGPIFEAIGLAMLGKFDDAKAKLKDALVPDFKYTKQEYAKLADAVAPVALDIKATFKGVTDDIKNSLGAIGPAATGPGGFAGAVDKGAKKAAESLEKFKEKAKEIQLDLADTIKDYTARSTDQLEKYEAKVADIQNNMGKLRDDFARENENKQKEYNKNLVDLFIQAQDKIADLQKEYAENSERFGDADTSEKERKKMEERNVEIREDLEKRKELLKQFYTEQPDIEKSATAERGRTDLDKLKEKFEEEKTESQRQFDEKMAELQMQLVQEKQAYQKQKEELIADTVDKYAKINTELQKGWDTMIKETKGKVQEMKLLEQQVLAIKASIEAAKASVSSNAPGAATGQIMKKAAGGPVNGGQPYIVGENGPELFVPTSSGSITPNSRLSQGGGMGAMNIEIMPGATLNISNEADERRLTQSIASELARLLQSQRSGLSTSF